MIDDPMDWVAVSLAGVLAAIYVFGQWWLYFHIRRKYTEKAPVALLGVVMPREEEKK